jgi:hypothetical protein
VVGHGELQGWHADPFQLHEARYFSAGRPTKLVRDGAAETFDEPPSSADDLAAAATRPMAGALTAGALTAGAPAGRTTEPEGLRPGGPDRADQDRADPDDAYPYGLRSARVTRQRPWDFVGWVAIAVLAAAALVIGVVVAGTPKPATTFDTGAAATVAFVSQAAQTTIAQRTANMTLSGTVQVLGQTAVVHGTGVVGLSGDAGTLDATIGFPGHPVAEKEILVNPAAALSALEGQGNTVRALGTKSVDGRVCSGYVISTGARPQASVTITIWVDPQHMVREMSMGMTLNVAGAARPGDLTMDFTSFGGPLRATA